MRRRPPNRLAGGVVLAGLLFSLAFIVAGCGGSSSASGTTPTTTAAGTTGSAGPGGGQSAAFQAFRSCLAQHGITTGFGRRGASGPTGRRGPTGRFVGPSGRRGPAGGFGGFRRNLTPAQQKAYTACASKLPAGTGGFFGSGGGAGGQSNPAFAKYTACLKAHGVTFGSTTSNAKAFAKATAACAKLRPSFGAGGAATTTTGGSTS